MKQVLVAATIIGTASFVIWRLRARARDFSKRNQCPKCDSWKTDEIIVMRRYHIGRIWPFGTNYAEDVKRRRWCVECNHMLINQLHRPLLPEAEKVEDPVA